LARDQTKALVTLHRASALAVLDVATRSWTRILEPADMSPNAIAWTEDGDSAIVTHLFAEGEHPFLSRVDFSGGIPKIRSQIRVLPSDPRHSSGLSAPYAIAEGGYLTTREHPAQIPSVTGRSEMWLPVQYNNITEDIYTHGPVLTLTYELPVPPSLTGPTVNPDGSVELRLAGRAGRTYRVQYSSDFSFWQELTNGVASSDEMLIHDLTGLNGGEQRFYRATTE
jgi:hypothetical protein